MGCLPEFSPNFITLLFHAEKNFLIAFNDKTQVSLYISCVELHGRSVGHGSMHGIVWNHTDHMLPCMELHVSQAAACDGTTVTTSAVGQEYVPGTLPIY